MQQQARSSEDRNANVQRPTSGPSSRAGAAKPVRPLPASTDQLDNYLDQLLGGARL